MSRHRDERRQREAENDSHDDRAGSDRSGYDRGYASRRGHGSDRREDPRPRREG